MPSHTSIQHDTFETITSSASLRCEPEALQEQLTQILHAELFVEIIKAEFLEVVANTQLQV